MEMPTVVMPLLQPDMPGIAYLHFSSSMAVNEGMKRLRDLGWTIGGVHISARIVPPKPKQQNGASSRCTGRTSPPSILPIPSACKSMSAQLPYHPDERAHPDEHAVDTMETNGATAMSKMMEKMALETESFVATKVMPKLVERTAVVATMPKIASMTEMTTTTTMPPAIIPIKPMTFVGGTVPYNTRYNNRVIVLWDLENVGMQPGTKFFWVTDEHLAALRVGLMKCAKSLTDTIKRPQNAPSLKLECFAMANTDSLTEAIRGKFKMSDWITLRDAGTKKGGVDVMIFQMFVDILVNIINDGEIPQAIVLISGDGDFVRIPQTCHKFSIPFILVYQEKSVNRALVAETAGCVLPFESIVGIPSAYFSSSSNSHI